MDLDWPNGPQPHIRGGVEFCFMESIVGLYRGYK